MNEAMRHEIVQRRQAGASLAGHRRGTGHLAWCRMASAGACAGPARRDNGGQAASVPAQHPRSVRANPQGTADPLSATHRGACLAGVASTRLHRQVHGGARAHPPLASPDHAGTRAAL